MTRSFKYFICILPLLAHACFGHAHIFVEYKVFFCVDDGGVKGAFINWNFDQMFSTFIKQEYDVDKNGELSRDEQTAIFNGTFMDLKKNDFFTVVMLNGKSLPVGDPQQFSAHLDKKTDMVSYTFFLPLNLPATKEKQRLDLYFFDQVMYVAFTILEKDIGLQNKSGNIDASLQMKTINYMNRPGLFYKEK